MKCKHFVIQELVSPEVYRARGEKAWQLLDPRLLITIDSLRDEFGPITINNWLWGGNRKYSGLRMPGEPYYSKYSQHSYGRAADCVLKDISVKEARQSIIDFPAYYAFKYISGIEMHIPWLHIDVRNSDELIKFYPS